MKSLLSCVACLGLITGAAAQGTQADYDRAGKLPSLHRGKVLNERVQPHWSADGTRFWYRRELAGGAREFILVDAIKGERRPAFDHRRLAAGLTKAAGNDAVADRLPLDRFALVDDVMTFRAFGRGWRCTIANYEVKSADVGADSSSIVLDLREPRPTRRDGERTDIVIKNQTARPVQLFWFATESRRQPYGTVAAGAERTMSTYAGHVWLIADDAGQFLAWLETPDGGGKVILPATLKPRGPPAPPPNANTGRAVVRDHNVFLNSRDHGETQLTIDGTAADGFGGTPRWSPDGKRFVVMRTRAGDDRRVSIIESSPRDRLQPKLHDYKYAKPGDKLPIAKPHLFDAEAGKEIPLRDDLFPQPWSITDLRWAPDSSRFTFIYNQRGHQVLRVVAVDAANGEACAVVEESSPTFIDYAHKQFCHWLDDTHELIWMSERDGWNHLYLIDAKNGAVKKQLTRGPWVVRGVDRVDAAKRQVSFRAGGIHPGQDPYQVHFARVDFEGAMTLLTEGDGTHTIESSPDGRFVVDTWSRVDQPPVTELRRADNGKLVCELERADWTSLLATGWKPPERFAAKGRDGVTDIYGVIYRPTTFDPAKKYPVIEQIYAGPQSAYVPKSFRAYHSPQGLAELGFIVVQIDGMGTSHRSKKFHDVCWKNLADAGFPDRIAWLKAAAATRPFMELTRVGIYGGSAGGQSALGALLFHGDFYKVAAADCGCHDNRMDKVWWNELWMGWPLGDHYQKQSNVTNAHKLRGKLLLTVGELDRNVDPASTLQVANALIQANKDFEFLVVPGAGHGVGETAYADRRRKDFFVRHLLGVEPRR